MSSTPYVIDHTQARELLARIDVPQILRKLFRDLAAGHAVQPAQQLVEFPQGAGDFINYLGVLAEDGVYGVKTSPYIVREQGPLVTAWTLLMSMQTGQPLLLCDAGELTTARTAATTAVAVDALAPLNATRLAIIGSGKVAQAHLHYVKGLRDWQRISVYSPSLSEDAETRALLKRSTRVEHCRQPRSRPRRGRRDHALHVICRSGHRPGQLEQTGTDHLDQHQRPPRP